MPPPPKRTGKRRHCDGCKACCGPALRINKPYLVVPRGETCRFVCDRGCSRWDTDLPDVCRGFLCNYLVEPGHLRLQERPDHVGSIIQRTNDRLTRISECLPGGLMRTLRNPVWGPIIRRDLRSGRRLLVSFLDDAEDTQAMQICRANDGLRCVLALCQADGTPVRVLEEPVHEREIYRAAMLREARHTVDAALLIERLGDRNSVVIAHGDAAEPSSRIWFHFRRRQAELLVALHPALAGPIPVGEAAGAEAFPFFRPSAG
jgi:hypothetical protein